MPLPFLNGSGDRLMDELEVAGNDRAILAGTAGPFATIQITGLLFESANNTVTAFAGGGQASATQLTAELNKVVTVATNGDSVKLPASAPGLTILVENATAKPMQVYGIGADTINGVAAATGVSQMSGSVVLYTSYAAGSWFANGLGTGYAGSFETMSYANALTAFATGGQASGTPITTMLSRFTTVVTIGDSALLPVSTPGMNITVSNAAANSMNVFPDVGGAVNGAGANAAFALPGGKTATFFCTAALLWHAILSA